MLSQESSPELPPHVVNGHISTLLGKAGVGGLVEFVRGGAAIVVRACDHNGEIVAVGMGQNVFEPLDIAAAYGRFEAIEGGEQEFRRGYDTRRRSQPETSDPAASNVLNTLNRMVRNAADITVRRTEPDDQIQVTVAWSDVEAGQYKERTEEAVADSFTTSFAQIASRTKHF